MVGIKFQPISLGQTRRIERAPPILKAPGARADAYLLLIGQIQNEIAMLAGIAPSKRGGPWKFLNIPAARWRRPKLD